MGPIRYVLASGTFDLFHVGHLQYLKAAAHRGPVVCAVTAGAYIDKGPGRPVFTDDERISIIAELECVDYAVLVPHRTMVEAIIALKPALYLKGAETRRGGNADLEAEMRAVTAGRGTTEFIGIVSRYSSGALLSGRYLSENIKEKPL